MWFSVVLVLFLSLVEVHSQPVAYVSLMGMNLTNHAYVDLTTVGEDISASGDTVRCHTDLESCCSSSQGIHRGDWYYPDGDVLVNTAGGSGNIYRRRDAQVVHLCRRNNAITQSGIYRCEIETIFINDNDVNDITGETVYVGLYPPNEGTWVYYIHVHLCTIMMMYSYS